MAIADFHAANQIHQELGVGAISNDAPRIAVLEATMIAALAYQGIMVAGIETACAALGDAAEPTVQSFAYRLAYLQRICGSAGEIVGLRRNIPHFAVKLC